MKKITSLFALVLALALVLMFSACAPDAATSGTTDTSATTETTDKTTATTKCTTATTATTAMVAPPVHGEKPIRILAIGNSFSVDGMEHLAIILKDAGYDDIILGNLYIGGCSLDTHWSNISGNKASYTFYLNDGDGWKSNSNVSVQTGVNYAEWDIITIQQVSQNSGMPDTFGNLQNIIDYVKGVRPHSKLYWHMTWAYQGNSSHSGFANYGKNQTTMYNAITGAVKSDILTNSAFEGFIPSGTAVQNLRSSYLGDTLTRDGFHLSNGVGRYTAALMWYKQLTGEDIAGITAIPEDFPEVEAYLPAIKEAVNNAYAKPLEVTKSSFAEKPANDLLVMTDADKAYLAGLGLDPEKYEVLDLDITFRAFYTSTAASNYSKLVTDAYNSPYHFATRLFTRELLPVGSVVKIAEGYEYRLEGWQRLNAKNNQKRLDKSAENFIVSEDIYSKYNFVAFNVSVAAGGNIKYGDRDALRIFVPIEVEKETPVMTEADREYLTSKGLNPDNYDKLKLDYIFFAYYNSTSMGTTPVSIKNSTANNLVNYLATRIISKEEMPVGSVIRLDEGYQYRPERFTELDKNSDKRADNTTEAYVIVDEAWWGSYNYAGFNVSDSAVKKLANAEMGTHFVIYVPKAN